MRFIQLIISIVLLFASPLFAAHSVFIVVHGTWGAESNWYAPGGDFFDELERVVEQKTVRWCHFIGVVVLVMSHYSCTAKFFYALILNLLKN